MPGSPHTAQSEKSNPTNRGLQLGRKPPGYIIGLRHGKILVCLAVIVSRQGRNCLEARINSFEDSRGWLSTAKHLQLLRCTTPRAGFA